MEALCVLIPVGFLLGIPILAYYLVYYFASQRQKELLAFAETGLTNGVLSGEPSAFKSVSNLVLTGEYDGFSTTLSFRMGGNKGQVAYLNLAFDVPLPAGTFEVSPATFLNRLGRWLGVLTDVKVGDEGIDDKYLLKGQQGSLTELLKEQDVERAFDELFRFFSFKSLKLDAHGRFTGEAVTHNNTLKRLDRMYPRFALIARACSRRQVSLKPSVTNFVWTGGTEQSLCPYCRDDLKLESDDMASCDQCQTLQHKECFEEAGGCSVFGCGGAVRVVRQQREKQS